jgi:hypothetical protein
MPAQTVAAVRKFDLQRAVEQVEKQILALLSQKHIAVPQKHMGRIRYNPKWSGRGIVVEVWLAVSDQPNDANHAQLMSVCFDEFETMTVP